MGNDLSRAFRTTARSGGQPAAERGGRPHPRSWRRCSKYGVAFRVSLRNQLAYAGEVWLRTIFIALIMFIFASLWRTTYGEMGRATVGGFTLAQMLWYLAITESIVLSRPRETFRIDEEVRTGDIVYALARPYHFVLFRYAAVLGERLPRLAINLAVALPLAWAFSGGVGLAPAGLAPGAVALLGAMTVDFLFVLSVQLLAFWVEDASGFQFIYDRLLMILGGVLLPVGLFPTRLAAVARALPFSAIINGPAQTLVGFAPAEFLVLLARQAAALLVAAAITATLFRLGARGIQSNGG